MSMFILTISCFDHFQFTLIHGSNIPHTYADLFFTALDFTCITSHTHNWTLFSLWLHLFILSGIIFPLFFLQVQCWDGSLCSAPSSHLRPLPRPTPIHKKVFKMKGYYSWDGPHSSPYWCTLCPNVWTCVYVLSAVSDSLWPYGL